MKETYEAVVAEIILFDSADIITVSGDTPLPETGE